MTKITNSQIRRVEVLQDVEEATSLVNDVMAGIERHCPVCGSILTLKLPGSGTHPGIYCETGCTKILLSMQPSSRRP